jgi:hypothetical protein
MVVLLKKTTGKFSATGVIAGSFMPPGRDAICIDGIAPLAHKRVKKTRPQHARHPVRSQFTSACRFADNNSGARAH